MEVRMADMEMRMAMLPVLEVGDRVVDDERVASRDQFQTVYHRTWPDVFSFAFVLTKSREEAEDLASDTYRRALEALGEGRGPRGEVLPWLLTICRRLAIDRHRRRRLIAWLPLEAATDPDDARQEAAFRSSEVWIWFEQLCRVLPPDQREALFLRFRFDLCDEDAAAVMGTSAGNVRTRVSRGLATLRARPEVMDI
jgi:RNA polymerase sigma-70 factor (ECF subfamily)